MDSKAIISLVILATTYILIGFSKVPRMYLTVFGAVLLIFFKVYTPEEIPLYINWETIAFLFGIFITVKIVEESGLFNYLSLRIAKKFNYNPLKILVFFPALSWFLAGFVDSITVIVFMAPLTYALSRILKFDPVPFIISEVCLANIGGAGTLMGDPPNVILGSMFKLGFMDFVIHNWISSFLAGFGAIWVFYKMNRKKLIISNSSIKKEELMKLVPEEAIEDRFLMKIGLSALFSTVFLLILRDFLKQYVSLNIAMCTLIPAFVVLCVKGSHPKLENILGKIDIETLIFFISLFAIVGSLEKTGVMQQLAVQVSRFSQNEIKMTAALFWGGAFSSAFIDNVPEAMSIGYLIKHLLPQISYSFTILIWGSSLGLDIGGSFTPIGGSANVVGYGFLEKHRIKVGWLKWLKLAFLPTIVALSICWLGLTLKIMIGFY